MLRVTKETDYAITLLGCMAARASAEVHSARAISEWADLPLPMVGKILGHLARVGIVRSHRGAGGGYSLLREAESVSVAEVIRALEGPISLVQCGSEPGSCEHEQSCPTRINWSRINKVVEDALERVPITEMAAPCECPLMSLDQGA